VEELRILLVSEDESFRTAAVEWITREPGLRLVGATPDRREAISLTVRARPDLAFVDAGMLVVSGYDVAGAISALAPRARLVGLVADGVDAAATRAHNCTFDGLVAKPGFATEALPMLRALFTSWRPTRADALLGESDVLQRLLAVSPSPAFGVKVDGTTLFVNRAAVKATGWSEEELVGRNWWQVLFPGDHYRQVADLFDHHPLGPVTGHEMTLVTKPGERLCMSWNLVPRRDAGGSLVELIGIATEITERRRVESALQRIAAGISSQTGGEWFTALARSMAEALGVRHAFVCRVLPGGRRARTLAMWSAGGSAEPLDYDLAGTPCEAALGERTCWFPDRVRERFPHDRLLGELQAESYMGAALVDRRGAVLGIIGVVHDAPLVDAEPALAMFRIYAERAVAEMERGIALAEAETGERRFRALVEHGQDVITSVDPEYRLTYVSHAAERVLGQDSVLHLGESLFAFVHPDDHADVRLCLSRLTDGAHAGPLTVRVRHRDGHWCSLETICSAFRSPDGSLVRVLNARDVTDRRRFEEQLVQAHRLESVGRLAAGLAHDFNNLLQAILGFAGVAARQLGESHPQQRELAEIHEAGTRAARLTGQLLAMSRGQVLNPCATPINTIVEGLHGLLRGTTGAGIELELALAPDAGEVFADPAQVEQVLLNLVVNARDALPEGGRVRISTSAGTLEGARARTLEVEPGEYGTLAVTDDGIGMDAGTQARAFEPFFTTKGASRGTGLGLSSVYGIVRQSGGAVEVESAPGAGSTFRVHLRRPGGAAPAAAPPFAAAGRPPSDVTVLVVDDEGAIRLLVERTLEMAGYRVITADAPERALELVLSHPGEIQVVVSDIVMPGMAVEQFFEELHRRRPSIAILLISGYPDEAVGWVRKNAPGHAFLAKPFHPARLLETVQGLVARGAADSGSAARH
jgi:PAS domain S-box-containing protein